MADPQNTIDKLSQAAFGQLVGEFLVILYLLGITEEEALIDHSTDAVAAALREGLCFCVEVDELKKPSSARRPFPLNRDELCNAVLDCAVKAAKAGILKINFNECLNSLQLGIQEAIEAMGYAKPNFLNDPGRGHWICYRKWVEVARACTLDASPIATSRQWAREKYPESFEV